MRIDKLINKANELYKIRELIFNELLNKDNEISIEYCIERLQDLEQERFILFIKILELIKKNKEQDQWKKTKID